MKILIPPHDYSSVVNKLEGKHPAPSHIDRFITRSTKVITSEGTIIAVYLPDRIASESRNKAYKVYKPVTRERIGNRPAAVGAATQPRIRQDGRLSNRSAVPNRVLKVLDRRGARQATLRSPTHHEELEKTAELFKQLIHLYKKYIPDAYAAQRAVAKERPDRIPLTPFTAVYLNKNLRSAYHRDKGNLPNTMSVITVVGGDYTGGELCFPRYRIAFALRLGDVLFFPGQELLHGNLAFSGTRLSVICYCERFPARHRA
jgi:2-oxoglutarate-Fe(II)-dependent dioxygenase family protein